MRATTVLRLRFRGDSGFGSPELRVPVAHLIKPEGSDRYDPPACGGLEPSDVAWQSDAALPALGHPRGYPSDWYWAAAEVSLEGPVDSRTAAEADCCDTALHVESGNDELSIRLDRPAASDDYFHQLELVVRRPDRVVLYTYALAFLPPLLLVALLAWQLLRPDRARGAPAPHEMTFGLAAILLALLPLRQVLVPADIPGLTTVDAIFALEIGLLLSAALAWAHWSGRPTAPAGPRAPHRAYEADWRDEGGEGFARD
jgi:hypothetical protein